MNSAYVSNVAPPSRPKRNRLMVRCSSRKLHRKKPERAISSFCPTEEVISEVLYPWCISSDVPEDFFGHGGHKFTKE